MEISMNTETLENSPRTPDPHAVGVPPLEHGSVIYALFKHMADEHGLTLLESELTEIISIVNSTLEARLEWWMRNAEGIALERYDLLETLREIRDPRPSMELQAKIIDAAIERNSPNTKTCRDCGATDHE